MKETKDMASSALKLAPTANTRQIYFQAKLFSDGTVEEQRSQWRRLPAADRSSVPEAEYLALCRRKNQLENKVIRLQEQAAAQAIRLVQKVEKQRQKAAEALQAYKKKSVPVRKFQVVSDDLRTARKERQEFANRVKKLRNIKLQAEQSVERKEVLVQKANAARAEFVRELQQHFRYSTYLEEQLERQQRFLDRCMTNLNKVGRVPTVKCIDCECPKLLSEFQLRTSNIKGKSEHWLINPFCRACRRERQVRYEAQRRDKAKLIAAGGVPTEKQEQAQAKDMATAFVERLPDGAVDRVLENLEVAEED